MSASSSERYRVAFERFQKALREAVHRGALGRAEVLAGRAAGIARLSDDPELLHLAVINRSMVQLEKGEVDVAERGLREVILQSRMDEVICRAAYYLAASLRRQGRAEKALVFARLAGEKATAVDDGALLARCHNLIGNLHLNQGQHDEAEDEYRLSLALWDGLPGDNRFPRAIVLDNIGYCLTLRGDLEGGIRIIESALALTLETEDRRCEAECRQDLAHAHLQAGRPAEGRPFAEAALEIARQREFLDIERNCHYLLGEMAGIEGNMEESDRHFRALESHFPDVPNLRSFLRVFDVSRLLTFHQ